ncbi:MAG: sporulation protein YunB [Christensenellaceae bacterium]|jgi:sporulation protein YunB|nr:sporulation protein YunB [Christensenellaceae bacterium]
MKKVHKVLLAVLLLIIVVLLYMSFVVNPVVFNYGYADVEMMTVKSINKGISEIMNINSYKEVTDIRRDKDGKILSINVDMVGLNFIANEIAGKTQQNLDTNAKNGINVPIGTFSGIPLFVGKGADIKLKVNPMGSINCHFDSSFVSAGINQTRHRIILLVNATVNLVLPLYTKKMDISVEMFFSESIIIGEVPQFYLSNIN